MYKDFKIIDADAHFYEPADIWDNYVEPAYYEQRPRVKEFYARARLDYEQDGVFFTKSIIRSTSARRYRDQEKKYGHAYRSWWNMESRIKDMEHYGWDVQVSLPTNGHLGAEISLKDVGFGAALSRAFNNWAHDFCEGDAKHRVKFAAVVPGGDANELAKETHRAVKELGAVTVIIATPSKGQMWHEPQFDQVWQTASELDVPLSLHGSATRSGDPASYARYNGLGGPFEALHHAINFPIENMISFGHFVVSGILDRYPKLKISILEANCGWLPFWLSRLEKCVEGRQSNTYDSEPLKATPWEYFQRQCFIAADADELGIKFCIEHVGDDKIVFNTDYPHADAPDPWEPVPQMVDQPISEESKRKIFWDNSVALYGDRLLEGVNVAN